MKKAFITGITGQDGAYLAEFLLTKGYEVHGLARSNSSFTAERIDPLREDPQPGRSHFALHHGDLTDTGSLIRIVQKIQPHEVYHVATQSHVAASFAEPEYAAESEALGVLRLLEAIRVLGLDTHTRFYHASTSELFGNAGEIPPRESSPFHPRSPYAVAKLYAHWITINYREAYGLYACNGIMFNHESPLRGEAFVTRKITRGLARVCLGLEQCVTLGNLDAKRDWGHARDYVEMQWLMLQQAQAQDFIIATGEQHSVRDFVAAAARELGIAIRWKGFGEHETAVVTKLDRPYAGIAVGQTLVRIDPRYFRPAEVDTLPGDANAAHATLGWKPKTTFAQLVAQMVREDLSLAQRDALCQEQGFRHFMYQE
jgi:GDPmannose 4,6-dehydratase